MSRRKERVLVTGGGGFLGSAIARRLLARGDEVIVLGRNRYPAVEALGARGVTFDLTRPEGLAQHLEGVDVVHHVAALAGMWGPREAYLAMNVEATRGVVAACREAGVRRLVFTGSPSATFHGQDEEGITEEQATYPEVFPFHYPETKAMAERLVLAANGPDLLTTSVRPHLIYGPEDPHLLPRMAARHRAGRVRVIGDGTNRIALTFVDNAAQAQVCAADALAATGAPAGRAYFVTDGEPVLMWAWLEDLFLRLGLPPITRRISKSTALRAAGVAEAVWRLLPLSGEPPITRFTVSQISASHWYSQDNARRDLGYVPEVSAEEAKERTVAWFKGRV